MCKDLEWADKSANKPSIQATLSAPGSSRGTSGTSASDAARAKVVHEAFEQRGLWIRSIQMSHTECITADPIKLKADMSVGGDFADSWSFAAPELPQYFFQMEPEEGKRLVALIVDWALTADRFVECSTVDKSSNKTFGPQDKRRTFGETKEAMGKFRKTLRPSAPGKLIGHNEIRSVQIDRSALVGLLWNPILRPTALSEGKGKAWTTWQDSRQRFQEFVNDIAKRGAGKNGLPVFRYEVNAANAPPMVLEYLDFISPM